MENNTISLLERAKDYFKTNEENSLTIEELLEIRKNNDVCEQILNAYHLGFMKALSQK